MWSGRLSRRVTSTCCPCRATLALPTTATPRRLGLTPGPLARLLETFWVRGLDRFDGNRGGTISNVERAALRGLPRHSPSALDCPHSNHPRAASDNGTETMLHAARNPLAWRCGRRVSPATRPGRPCVVRHHCVHVALRVLRGLHHTLRISDQEATSRGRGRPYE